MRSPAPAKERLAALLKQGSSIPELKDFRDQCRDVFRLGGVIGLDEWIEARRDLGLLPTRQVERAADDLQAALGRVFDEATLKPSHALPVSRSWEERQRLINEREDHRRNAKPKPPLHRGVNHRRHLPQHNSQRDVP